MWYHCLSGSLHPLLVSSFMDILSPLLSPFLTGTLDHLRTAHDEAREKLHVSVSISEGTQVPGSEKFCCTSPPVSCVAYFLLPIPNCLERRSAQLEGGH